MLEVVLSQPKSTRRPERLKVAAVRLRSEVLLAVDQNMQETELCRYDTEVGSWFRDNVAVQPDIRPLGRELHLVVGDLDRQPYETSTHGYCFFVFRDEKEMVYLQRNDGRENVFMLAPRVLRSDPLSWVHLETQVRCTRLTIAPPTFFAPELAQVAPGIRSRVSGLAERALA